MKDTIDNPKEDLQPHPPDVVGVEGPDNGWLHSNHEEIGQERLIDVHPKLNLLDITSC